MFFFLQNYLFIFRTFLSGYGVPPLEELSMFVIIVATIGLGIPFLLLAIGGCYICIKRTRNTA